MKKTIYIILSLPILYSCIDIRYIQYIRGKKPIQYFYKLYDPHCDYSNSKKIKFEGAYVEQMDVGGFATLVDYKYQYSVYKFLPNGRIYAVGSFRNYPTNDSLISEKSGGLEFYKLKDNEIEIEHLGNNDLWRINNFISYGEIRGDSIFIYASSYYGSSNRDPEKRLLVYDSTLTTVPMIIKKDR